jgi:hypothetical protein
MQLKALRRALEPDDAHGAAVSSPLATMPAQPE